MLHYSYYTLLHYTYYTIQHYSTLYNTILHYTILHYPMLTHHRPQAPLGGAITIKNVVKGADWGRSSKQRQRQQRGRQRQQSVPQCAKCASNGNFAIHQCLQTHPHKEKKGVTERGVGRDEDRRKGGEVNAHVKHKL